MSKCIDPKTGLLLHAYELNQLSDEDAERFELHLLECESCFSEIKKFDKTAELVANDPDIRKALGEVITGTCVSESIWVKIWKYLWSDTLWVFKPALAYFLIILLVYPAYIGLVGIGNNKIKPVNSIFLVPERSSKTEVLSIDKDLVIGFVYRSAEVGKRYKIILKSNNDDIIFKDDNYTGFNKNEVGKLFLPFNKLKTGNYRLIIIDPQAELPINITEYSFKIELQ